MFVSDKFDLVDAIKSLFSPACGLEATEFASPLPSHCCPNSGCKIPSAGNSSSTCVQQVLFLRMHAYG